MKQKDKTTMQAGSVAELKKTIAEAQVKLSEIRTTRFTKPVRNVREVRALRNKIAVAYSFLKSKELKHE
jgi:ribosomal protein L29